MRQRLIGTIMAAAAASGVVVGAQLIATGVRVDGTGTNGTFVAADVGQLQVSYALAASNNSSVRGSCMQGGFRVVVSSTAAKSAAIDGDVFDSGLVINATSQTGILIPTNSPTGWLWVRVQALNQLGQIGPFSDALGVRKPALLLSNTSSPTWITAPGPKPVADCDFYQRRQRGLLRAELPPLPQGTTWASGVIHVSTLGYGTVTINGMKPDPRVELDPGWTTYSKRALFSAFDITSLLPANGAAVAVGVELASGWWSPLPMRIFGQFDLRSTQDLTGLPMLWIEVILVDSAGKQHSLQSSEPEQWQGALASRVVFENVYLGQVTDNRQGAPGFDKPGFAPVTAWKQAEVVNATTGPLMLQDMPPVRSFHTDDAEENTVPIANDDDDGSGDSGHGSDGGWPISISEPQAGVYVLDFGSDRTGVVDIVNVTGSAGVEVNVSYGEILFGTGLVDYVSIMGGAIGRWNGSNWGDCARVPAVPIDTLLLAGTAGGEAHHPRYTWRVFRYAQVNNWPTETAGEPTLRSFRRVLLHTDIARVGHFASSLPMLAQLRRLADRAFLNNWVSVQSDCPGRERFGYGADALVSAPAAARVWDVERFFRKRVRDYGDAQRLNGAMPETAPYVGIATCSNLGPDSGPVAWGAAHIYLQHLLYALYGGTSLVEEQADRALAFVAFMNASSSLNQGVLLNGLEPFDLKGYEPGCNSTYAGVQGTTALISQATLLADLLDAASTGGNTINRAMGHVAAALRAVAAQSRQGFQAQLFDPSTGRVGGGSMDEQLLALGFGAFDEHPLPGNFADTAFDTPPSEAKSSAAVAAAAAIDQLDRFWRGNGTLIAGPFVSLAHQHAVDWGLGERMWAWVTNSSFPSYGYFLRFGATAMPEHWDTPQEDDSWSHAWLGSVSQFLSDHVAGLRPGGVGASSLIAAPQPFGWRPGSVPGAPQLDWAEASLDTVRGRMAVSWAVTGGKNLQMNVTLPPNSVGSVALVPLMSAADTGQSSCLPSSGGGVCRCVRLSSSVAGLRVQKALRMPVGSRAPPADAWDMEDSTGCSFDVRWG